MQVRSTSFSSILVCAASFRVLTTISHQNRRSIDIGESILGVLAEIAEARDQGNPQVAVVDGSPAMMPAFVRHHQYDQT
ncbi:MAG: hypothetical protein WKF84_01990 [Pyrinomonadaceae bacterium]